jgi:ABC-type sugar transport system permease subunit
MLLVRLPWRVGGGLWRCFGRPASPLPHPPAKRTGINLTIATLGAFGVFDLIYVMTQGGPVMATDVAMNQVYLQAFQFNRVGYAAAESVAILAITATLSVLIMRGMNRSEAA